MNKIRSLFASWLFPALGIFLIYFAVTGLSQVNLPAYILYILAGFTGICALCAS